MNFRIKTVTLVMAALAGLLVVSGASADHQWGRYKWKSSAPVTLTVGNNIDETTWENHLHVAIADWDASPVLNLTEGAGGVGSGLEACTPSVGKIEVCNFNYGNNGWLGIASVWIAKGKDITKANAKMNDYYFDQPSYNESPEQNSFWRQLVMCQEIGHDFGLTHQDENFENTPIGTCMDYTGGPLTEADTHPNQHDYDQLVAMYGSGGGGGGGNGKGNNKGGGKPSFAPLPDAGEFGRAIDSDASGRANLFERDLNNGQKVITHVFWAY